MTDPALQSFPVGGLDETNDDVYGPATSMRVCQNVVFPDGMSAAKRAGLRSGATLISGRRFIRHGDQTLMVDGHDAWTLYGPSASAAFYARGQVSPCMASRSLFAGSTRAAGSGTDPDFPVVPRGSIGYDLVTGYSVRAWSDGFVLAVQVFDETSKSFVTPVISLNDTAGTKTDGPIDNPRVCIIGSVAFVIYFDHNNATTLWYQAIDLTNIAGGFSAAATMALLTTSATMVWDAETLTGVPRVAVIVCDTGAGTVTQANFTASGTTLSFGGAAAVDAPASSPTFNACALRANSTDGVAMTYVYTTGASSVKISTQKWAVYGLTNLAIQAAVVNRTWTYDVTAVTMQPQTPYACGVERITGVGSGGTAQWITTLTTLYQVGNVPISNIAQAFVFQFSWNVRTTANTGGGSFNAPYGPQLSYQAVTKPRAITVAGVARIYNVIEFATKFRAPGGQIVEDSTGIPNGLQTAILCEIPYDRNQSIYVAPLACAVTAVQSAGDLPPASLDLVAIGASTLFAIGTEVDQAKKTSLSAVTYDFASSSLWQAVRLADWTWIAGGLPMIFDGSQLCEAGFITPPPTPIAVVSTAGTGSVTSNPKCQYLVVEVQQDGGGNIHRSAPSDIITIDASAGGGADQIDVYVYPRRMTYRQSISATSGDIGPNPVRIQLYRNTSTTPTIFNLLAEILNDTTNLGVIHYDDTVPDAQLIAKPLLPTAGGAVESDGPPNLSALSVHADRVVGIAEDGRTMWFTTAWTPGECPRFSLPFTIPWPEGPITATWSLEQRLSAATASRIYYLIGEGPTDTGAGVDWSTPILWQQTLGVSDARGVALYDGGAILATNKGLYVNGRDGSFTWLQKPRKTALAYPAVTSILPLNSDGVVRIACNASAPVTVGPVTFTPGVVLHWDYRHDRWSTHVSAPVGGYPLGADDQIEVSAGYSKLNAVAVAGVVGAQVSYETPGASLDGLGSTWVPMTLAWGWVSTGSVMQGWGETSDVLILGRYSSAHTLTLSVARDFSAAYDAAPAIWDDATLTANAAAMGGVVQVRRNLPSQTGEAISMSLADSEPTTGAFDTGIGVTVQSILLLSTAKRGQFHQLPQGATQ